MSAKKQQVSSQQQQLMRDKKYRLLKNLMYKYQISLKSVTQKQKQDNFIAYSIIKKVSNTGWFSNQRLLVIDCTTKQLFYLTKVPDFVIDQSNPLQIENIRQSPFVKERISLNSFAKQIKNVTRNQHLLTIQWLNQVLDKDKKTSQQSKKWVLEMTSAQLAKDWMNLISIIEKGKLSDTSSVKKYAVTPQKIDDLKRRTPNLSSTPKSISDVQSIHMKSQNWNAYNSSKKVNENKEYMTPNNKAQQKQQLQRQYFRKQQSNKQVNKLNQLNAGESPKRGQQKFVYGISEQQLNDYQLRQEYKIGFEQIARQFLIKSPSSQNSLFQQQGYHPLSQQIKQPIDLLKFEKIRRNTNKKFTNNMSIVSNNGLIVSNNGLIVSNNGLIVSNNGLNLYRKYNIPQSGIIQQVREDIENENLLSQQLRNINNNQQENHLFSSSLNNRNIKLNINSPSPSNSNNRTPGSRVTKKSQYVNNLSQKQSVKQIQPIIINNNNDINSPQYSSYQTNIISKSPQSLPLLNNNNNKSLKYWNTYNPIRQLPKLQSTYNWNEVYFNIFLQYYSLYYDRKYQDVYYSKKYQDDESKIFDVLFKLQKHVQKFQLYCSKAIRNYIDQQILGNQQSTVIANSTTNNQSNNNTNNNNNKSKSKIINIRQQLYHKKSINNAFNENDDYQKPRIKPQLPNTQNVLQNKKQIYGDQQQTDNKQKIISFQFQGIQIKLFLNQNQLYQDYYQHNKQQCNNNPLSKQQQSKFYQYSEKLNKRWQSLINISYLHPHFVQRNKHKPQLISYFHLFTPMISIIQYHGIKFYCQAIFNPNHHSNHNNNNQQSPINHNNNHNNQQQHITQSKYTQFDMKSKSTQKQLKNYLNINKYLKKNISKTSLSYFPQDKLIQQITTLYLNKQLQTHNYLVINQLQYNIQKYKVLQHNQIQQLNQQLINNAKQQFLTNSYKRLITFQAEINNNNNNNYTSYTKNIQQNNHPNSNNNNDNDEQAFVVFLQDNKKLLQILECLQNQFSKSGAIKLTSHQSFIKYLHTLTPNNILSSYQQLTKLYHLISTQLQYYRTNILLKQELKYLLNQYFINYFIKLIHNQLIICLILTQINLVMRDFITILHFHVKQYNQYQSTLNKGNQHLINLYRTKINLYRTKIKSQHQIQQLKNKYNPQNTLINIKPFPWLNHYNTQSTLQSQHSIPIKDLKSLTNQQLSNFILKQIVNKAVNSIFVFSSENNKHKQSNQKKIKLKMQIIQWVLTYSNNYSTNFNKQNIQTLAVNYIYQGILYELNIQKYFDPVSLDKKSLQNQYRIAQIPKTQVQKLIRDPYLSYTKNQQNIIISSKKQLLSSKSLLSSSNNNKQQQSYVQYISRLKDNTENSVNYGYGIKITTSLLNSFPLCLMPQKLKMRSQLQQIQTLILQKDFNSAIEIYYLMINGNKKSSTIYHQYFKNAKNNKNNNLHQITTNHKNQNNKFIVNNKNKNTSPALLTYVLATQCVAFAFLQLLHGKTTKKLQQNYKTNTNKNRRHNNQYDSAQSNNRKKQDSQGQKTQYHALILKYNDMSYFGGQIIYGRSHIVHFINQVIFGFTKIMNKQFIEGKQYLEQCQRIILQKSQQFEQKHLILPVLYIKAKNDLLLGSYRSAILSVRILMKCLYIIKQSIRQNNDNNKSQYWLQKHLTTLLQSNIPQCQSDSIQNKLNSYNYLSYQILILCNQNDPSSDIRKNRLSLKQDIINQLKSLYHIDKKYIKYLKLLWTLQTKLMVNDNRKFLIKRTLSKLYSFIVKKMNLKKQINNYQLKTLLNPLNTSKHSTNYLYANTLFMHIFSKSQKYYNYLLNQFQISQFRNFHQYLYNKMSITQNKPSQAGTLQHYNLKKQLFKDIILIIKFIILLDQHFVLQTISTTSKSTHNLNNFKSFNE